MGEIIPFPKRPPYSQPMPAGMVAFISLKTAHLFWDCPKIETGVERQVEEVAKLQKLCPQMEVCQDCIKHIRSNRE